MQPLDGRDAAVVQLVTKFKQVSSQQIRDVLFHDRTSHTSLDRTLRRLVEQHYLARIERRIVGGSHGGSGQYVYQLGRRGYFILSTGRYQPSRAVNFHSLAIVDCFIRLRHLEREGRIKLTGLSTEPDCWVDIAGVQLKPDMRVDLVRSSLETMKLWIEVDMGSEQQRQLRGKLESYWRAYNDADVDVWPVFPRVLWLAVDDERAKELRWLVQQLPRDAQVLFSVTTHPELQSLFQG